MFEIKKRNQQNKTKNSISNIPSNIFSNLHSRNSTLCISTEHAAASLSFSSPSYRFHNVLITTKGKIISNYLIKGIPRCLFADLSDISYFHIQLNSHKTDFKSYCWHQPNNGNQLKITKSFNWLKAIESDLLPRQYKPYKLEKLCGIMML